VPLGDSLTVRSYADIPDLDFLDLFGNHKKRSSAFVALKVDIIDVVTYLLFYLFIFITIFCYAFHKLHCVPLLSTMHHHVRYFTFLCMVRTHFISWFLGFWVFFFFHCHHRAICTWRDFGPSFQAASSTALCPTVSAYQTIVSQ
jgi:hypothetical protein